MRALCEKAMKAALKALLYMMVVLVLIVFGLIIYKDQIIQPNWHVEHNAVRSNSHPLAGFWKSGGCSGEWGLAIGPAGDGLYYISFCGPGGCFEEGAYVPITAIENDPKYNVTNENTIEVMTKKGWSTYARCPGRT